MNARGITSILSGRKRLIVLGILGVNAVVAYYTGKDPLPLVTQFLGMWGFDVHGVGVDVGRMTVAASFAVAFVDGLVKAARQPQEPANPGGGQ